MLSLKLILPVLTVLIFGVIPVVQAEEASPWAAKKEWSDRAMGKLLYGAKNMLLGWTEIITELDEAMWVGERADVGFMRGLWNATGQTLGGAYHVLTFPHTSWDLPLPEGGVGWQRASDMGR